MKIQTPSQTSTKVSNNPEVVSQTDTRETATSTFCGTTDRMQSTRTSLTSSGKTGHATPTSVGVEIPSPRTPRANPNGLPAASARATVATAKPVPSLESVKALGASEEQLAQVKEIFSSLAEPTALPKGEFKGDFVGLYSDNTLAKALVPWLWEGVTLDGSEAKLVLNPWVSWFLPQETGIVSLAESVYDGRQTIRVDYEDRFWETRRLDDNRFLSIVTDKESNKVGDVHTLTLSQ